MDDLGNALIENPDMIMMGGGNPGRVPAMEAVFQRRLEAVLADPQQRHRLFGRYQAPQGDLEFRQAVADLLAGEFGWRLGAGNIAVSNGSQSAFFMLFNSSSVTSYEVPIFSAIQPVRPVMKSRTSMSIFKTIIIRATRMIRFNISGSG